MCFFIITIISLCSIMMYITTIYFMTYLANKYVSTCISSLSFPCWNKSVWMITWFCTFYTNSSSFFRYIIIIYVCNTKIMIFFSYFLVTYRTFYYMFFINELFCTCFWISIVIFSAIMLTFVPAIIALHSTACS